MSDRPASSPVDMKVALRLLGAGGLACYLLGSAWGVVAISAMIVVITGRCAYVRAHAPGGFLFEAGSVPKDDIHPETPDDPPT